MASSFRSPGKVLRRLRYLPLAARTVRNWPAFVWNYALGFTPRQPYVMRNGARVQIGRGVDHVPLIEIFFLEEYGNIPDRAVILDLGANIGAFSVYAANAARAARIFAYEPWPDFFQLMKHNVMLNGQEGAVSCFNSAVAAESGSRTIFAGGAEFSFPTLLASSDAAKTGQRTVPSTTLTEILAANNLAHVDLLKMDCEGAEYEILYSTPRAVLEKIAEVRMEYHDLDADQRNVQALERYMTDCDYTVLHQHASSPTNGTIWFRRGPAR